MSSMRFPSKPLTVVATLGLLVTSQAGAQTIFATSLSSMTSTSSLFMVNPITGEATPIGDTGMRVGAIDFDPTTGLLWGAARGSTATTLVEVDLQTGTASNPVVLSAPLDVRDLSFLSDGRLFASVGGAGVDSEDVLEIDPSSGVVTSRMVNYGGGGGLGSVGLPGNQVLFLYEGNRNADPGSAFLSAVDPDDGAKMLLIDLAGDAGVLTLDRDPTANVAFGFFTCGLGCNGELASISLVNGQTQLIGTPDFGPNFSTATGIAIVPEPGASLQVGALLLGVLGWRQRSRTARSIRSTTGTPLARRDGQHRTHRTTHDLLRHASPERVEKTLAALGGHCDEVDPLALLENGVEHLALSVHFPPGACALVRRFGKRETCSVDVQQVDLHGPIPHERRRALGADQGFARVRPLVDRDQDPVQRQMPVLYSDDAPAFGGYKERHRVRAFREGLGQRGP